MILSRLFATACTTTNGLQGAVNSQNACIAVTAGKSCTPSGGGFLTFPTWYHYLSGIYDSNGTCTVQFNHLSDVWLVVAAIIEILLRIGALIAVGFVIYGGIQYSTSQGSSDKTTQAKSTILNAFIGLAITVIAASVVSFIAGSIK